jgi:mRNA interferase MazF
VVQNDRGNAASSYTVVAAISSTPLAKAYPFTVALQAGDGGLPRAGHVNCAQLLTVDQTRLGERIGILSAEKMAEVNEALRYELDIP